MRVARLFVMAGALFGSAAAEPASPHAEFAGVWSGRVCADTESADIGFAFRPTPAGLAVVFSMPAMSVDQAPLGPAQFEGDELVLPGLDTRLHRSGEQLVGTFAIPRLRVELHRALQLPPADKHPVFPAGPTPAWSVSLGGQVWGSPVVADGVVYVATAGGDLCARDAESGSAVWGAHGNTPYYGTPAVTGDAVYLVDRDATLVSIGRTDGRLRWRRRLFNPDDANTRLPDNPTFNRRTPTPLIAGARVYVGSPDGGLYGLDAADGETRWRIEVGAPIYATASVDGPRLRCGAMDGTVCTIDLATHAIVARTKLPRGVVSTPMVEGGTCVVGARDYLLYGLDAVTLAPRWRHSFWFSWVESTPALCDGVMYIGGSDFARITALEPATGAVKWQTRVYGLTCGTPIVAADLVYVGTHRQSGAVIPHEAAIFALDRATGAVRWRIAIVPDAAERTGVVGSLAYDRGRIYAALFDGTLQMYRP